MLEAIRIILIVYFAGVVVAYFILLLVVKFRPNRYKEMYKKMQEYTESEGLDLNLNIVVPLSWALLSWAALYLLIRKIFKTMYN